MKTLGASVLLVAALVTACGPDDFTNSRSNPSTSIGLAGAETQGDGASSLPRLAVGQSLTLDVPAVKYWSFAVSVRSGEQYTFSTPPDARWVDYFIASGPNGYATEEAPLFSRALLKAFEPFRRLPQEKWFVLSGCVGFNSTNCFAVGAASTMQISTTGPLSFFANDVPIQYYNNLGSIQVTVRRDR